LGAIRRANRPNGSVLPTRSYENQGEESQKQKAWEPLVSSSSPPVFPLLRGIGRQGVRTHTLHSVSYK